MHPFTGLCSEAKLDQSRISGVGCSVSLKRSVFHISVDDLVCDGAWSRSDRLSALTHLPNVSGHSVLAKWQIQEEACGEPTAASALKCRNINKLAVLEEAQDSGKFRPLSSVQFVKIGKRWKQKALFGKAASLRKDTAI